MKLENHRATHFINDIMTRSDEVCAFLDGVDADAFAEDTKTLRAVERNLEVIGEATKNLLHVAPELKSSTFEKNLQEIRNGAVARHDLAHDYNAIDPRYVYQAAHDIAPQLARQSRAILKENGRAVPDLPEVIAGKSKAGKRVQGLSNKSKDTDRER